MFGATWTNSCPGPLRVFACSSLGSSSSSSPQAMPTIFCVLRVVVTCLCMTMETSTSLSMNCTFGTSTVVYVGGYHPVCGNPDGRNLSLYDHWEVSSLIDELLDRILTFLNRGNLSLHHHGNVDNRVPELRLWDLRNCLDCLHCEPPLYDHDVRQCVCELSLWIFTWFLHDLDDLFPNLRYDITLDHLNKFMLNLWNWEVHDLVCGAR